MYSDMYLLVTDKNQFYFLEPNGANELHRCKHNNLSLLCFNQSLL